MTISLIACITKYNNKLAIGIDNTLLFKLKRDIDFFKNITTNSLSIYKDSTLQNKKNIVLMGRKTYFSIPEEYRPLKNRINIILTTDNTLINLKYFNENEEGPFFMTLNTFKNIYNEYNPNVFIIGGAEIYNIFLDYNLTNKFIPSKLYITEVVSNKFENEPNVFMNNINENYKLFNSSEKYLFSNGYYRFLEYQLSVIKDI